MMVCHCVFPLFRCRGGKEEKRGGKNHSSMFRALTHSEQCMRKWYIPPPKRRKAKSVGGRKAAILPPPSSPLMFLAGYTHTVYMCVR